MTDPGYIDYPNRRVWHDRVKLFQHWLDSGFDCGNLKVRALIKKWLRKAKREQAKKEVKTT